MGGYGSQAGAGGQVSESQVMAAVSGRVLSSRADVGHATPQTFALPRRSAPHRLSVEHTGLSGGVPAQLVGNGYGSRGSTAWQWRRRPGRQASRV